MKSKEMKKCCIVRKRAHPLSQCQNTQPDHLVSGKVLGKGSPKEQK
jgi:hypothetical protein